MFFFFHAFHRSTVNDTNLERLTRFQRDLETRMACYGELSKERTYVDATDTNRSDRTKTILRTTKVTSSPLIRKLVIRARTIITTWKVTTTKMSIFGKSIFPISLNALPSPSCVYSIKRRHRTRLYVLTSWLLRVPKLRGKK